MAVRFRWDGPDVIIETSSGNYLYCVDDAHDAYHDGDDIIVISKEMSKIRFTKNGIRKFE